jgi:hypothetical protein
MSSVMEKPGDKAYNVPAPPARSALYIDEGTIQALKWLALLLMLGDHANKYLASGKIEWMFAAGRLCLPLFCFVLAYNLNRPGALAGGAFLRLMKRTALVGWIATPFFILLGGLGWGWWPLNIMFMLFVAAWIMLLLERRRRGDRAWAVAAFLIGGAFVEFWWIGIALCLAARRYCKRPGAPSFVLLVLVTTSLYIINHNLWALAALPLVALAPYVYEVPMPRWRNVFYIVYPAHLTILISIRWWLGMTG